MRIVALAIAVSIGASCEAIAAAAIQTRRPTPNFTQRTEHSRKTTTQVLLPRP